MKHFLFIFLMVFSCQIAVIAQENEEKKEVESVKPTDNVEIIRKVYALDIEGKIYKNVTVKIKSLSPEVWVSDHYRVKVLVTDSIGKKIYKKTFKDSYLYIFSKGQIQVGKPHFNMIVIDKPLLGESFMGIIREKEGVF